MRLLTLFSGIGSPEQGAKRVYKDKLELVGACEWDKFARESFNANYKIDPKHFHNDISDMDGTQYKDKVDILVGGSPCQDFSLAGLRKGIEGNKGILIYEYIRIIKEAQPPIFIYENVKGILSDKGGRTIKEFVQAFRDMGYHCHYEVLNTKDYGVPQNRERVFLVGFKDSEHYHNFSFAPKIKLEKNVSDILEKNVSEKYNLSEKSLARLEKADRSIAFGTRDTKYMNCLIAQYSKIPTDGFYIKEPSFLYGRDKINIPYNDTKGFKKVGPGDTINFSFLNNPNSRGTCRTDGLLSTLDTSCNQAFIEEYFRIRKLTPREAFRGQDFTDTFKFVVSDTQLYSQAGNSISVNMMEMIFNQIEKSRYGNTDSESLF